MLHQTASTGLLPNVRKETSFSLWECVGSMNFEYMILPALQGIGMNISCILTHWLLLEVTWRASDPMFSAEDYGPGHTGVDFCYVEAVLVADPNCYLH